MLDYRVSDEKHDAKVVRKSKDEEEKSKYRWDIVWINVVLLAILHVSAMYGFWIRSEAKLESHIFYRVIGFVTTISITAGAHRLWCHRTYEASNLCQILMMCCSTMTYQNSLYIWCRDHRVHHKYSETDADPHNAKRGFFFSHVGWLMVRKHRDVIEKGRTVDMSDLEANPIIMFQHRYYIPLILVFFVGVPILVPWYFWGESLKVGFFTIVAYRYIVTVNHVWFINSLAHLYGNKPYDKKIGPMENTYMMFFGAGEGFHNYHHTFPWDYKASEWGGDSRNLTAHIIDFFAWIGWAGNRKTAPRSVVEEKISRSGDGSHVVPSTDTCRIFGMDVKYRTLEDCKNYSLQLLFLYLV